jgi:ATP-binding cassette subfamily C (CFTR/MRP) protein 1
LSQYAWRVRRVASMLRGSIIGLVYQESLLLDLASPGVNPTSALTLISADADNAVQSVYHLHEVWGSLLEIGIADYLIYRQMGAACAMPFACAFGWSRPYSSIFI